MTPDDHDVIARYRAEWYAAATAPGPVDRARAEAAAQAVRAAHGLPPVPVTWVASPRESLWYSLGSSLGASLGDSLRVSLRGSLGASLWTSLWASLWTSLRDSLRDSIRDSLWTSIGPLDAGWVATGLCGRELGATYSAAHNAQLDAWAEAVRSCGPWWCLPDKIVMMDRQPTP